MKYSLNILNYNYIPGKLIEHLSKRELNADIWGINLWDDGSDEPYFTQIQQLIKQFPNIRFFPQDKNSGRSSMRNKIIDHSNAEWTVCMDSDLAPLESFLTLIENQLRDTKVVYKGVHSYSEQRPRPACILHWKYGKIRETRSAREASTHPYRYFNTSLFAFHRTLQSRIKFDSSIQKYGHEDTLLASRLKKENIMIRYIDLPLIHMGLKTTDQFLTQQLQAVENLLELSINGKDVYSPLWKWGNRIRKWPIVPYMLKSEKINYFLRNRLSSKNPRLLWLDLLKLRKFLILSKEFE